MTVNVTIHRERKYCCKPSSPCIHKSNLWDVNKIKNLKNYRLAASSSHYIITWYLTERNTCMCLGEAPLILIMKLEARRKGILIDSGITCMSMDI